MRPARRIRLAAVTALWLVAATSSAHACQVGFGITAVSSPEPAVTNEFGQCTWVVDIQGDGFDDLIVMESGASVDGVPQAGRGWILTGPGFDVWARFASREPVAKERLGSGGCRTGDVNADGFVDILVGSPDYKFKTYPMTGRAHLFLGPDYVQEIVLREPDPQGDAWFGFFGLLMEDMDGDGRDDVLVAAPRRDLSLEEGGPLKDSGRLYYWNATQLFDPGGLRHPHVIEDPLPTQSGNYGGIITASRMNGDHQPDLLVSSGVSACCPLMTGQVYLFDGLGPDLIDEAGLATIPCAKGVGSSIDVTDVTGDGERDLILGAPSSDLPECDDAGRILVMEGPSFDDVAFTLESPLACQGDYWLFGGTSTRVIDVDRDGYADILSQEIPKAPLVHRFVHVFWGPWYDTVESLGDEFAPIILPGFGSQITPGDFDGDGFEELAITATLATQAGRIYVYDPLTLTADVASLSASTGGDMTLALRMAPEDAGKAYVVGLGASGSTPGLVLGPGSFLPLVPDAITEAGLELLGSPILQGFTGRLDENAEASCVLRLPPGMASPLVGQQLVLAALVMEPDGRPGPGSSALTLTIEP